MTEKETLGIFVPTNNHIDHLIGIAEAAKKAGKTLCIFLTHNGCLITQDPKYQLLADIVGSDENDDISLCNVRWQELGLKDEPLPAGMGAEGLASQSRHCAMVGTCDRYLVI